ncbi:hypothetical protein L4C34_03525 [Vibrio profundum]
MNIPTQFGVSVSTPDPVQVKIDVSERTMLTIGFVTIVSAILIKRLKG